MSPVAGSPPRSRAASRQLARLARRCAAAAAAVTAAVLLLPMAVHGPLFGLDLTLTDLGTTCAVQHALHDGLGLWLSPWLGNGGVLAMQPAAQVFYPPRWPFLALPADWASALHQSAHLVAAAAATAWLARSFRVRPALATTAGVVFALSGPTLDLLRHANYVVAATWLPLAWAATRHALSDPARWRGLAWLALALTGLLLGGEPHAFAIALVVIVVEAALRVAGPAPRPWRRVAWLPVAIGSALAASAILLLPLQAELALSHRSQPLPLAKLLHWSFDASLWPAALLPGDLFRDGAWALWRDGEVEAIWNPAPYLGALFVLLAIQGLRVGRARSAAAMMVLAGIAALGDATPIWPWLVQVVPGLDWFRFPSKYLVVTTLAGSLCAALTLQRLQRDRRRARLLALLSTVTLLTLLAAMGAVHAAADVLEALAVEAGELAPLPEGSLVAALERAILRAAAPLLGGLLLWRHRSPRAMQLVALCWLLDVSSAAASMLRAGPALADLHSPLRALPGAVLCHDGSLHVARLKVPGAMPGWGQAALQRLVGLPELQACDRLTAAVPYSPLASRVMHRLYYLPGALTGATARAVGCTHLVTADAQVDPALREIAWPAPGASAPPPGPRLYALRDPLPEVALVRGGRLHDEASAIAALPGCQDAGAALAVLDDPLQRLGAAPAPLPSTGVVAIARVDSAGPTQVAIQLDGAGPAVIALRRAYLAGWEAHLDGRELPVLRAAGTHLAVLVDDAGGGVLQLRYRPPRLTLAIALSVVGWMALGGLWWFSARAGAADRRRRERSP